jgi:WD40 repeat protein
MPARAEGEFLTRPLYRQTFLRRHVPIQLERRIDDVLALQSIQQRLAAQLPRAFREKYRRNITPRDKKAFENWLRRDLLTLKSFFRGDDPVSPNFPDLCIYRMVPVFEFGRPESVDWPELSSLLIEMANDGDHQGLILRGRSGAGKTVAQIKAFCDCAWAPRPGDDPRQTLAGLGHVPCWLDVGRVPDGDEHLIERMLLRQSEIDAWCSVETLEDWLRSDRPRLLIFCDLNAASEVKPEKSRASSLRVRLARGLERFQTEHGDCGHRSVVAYRASRSSDEIVNQLAGSFRSIDLRPLGLADATEYLRAHREFEARAIGRVESEGSTSPGLPLRLPERDIDAEVTVLAELVRRYARTSRTTSESEAGEDEWAPESLISTPLLMHFVSLLTGEELREKVKTLTDLYRLVVDQHIERDRIAYGRNQNCSELGDRDRARPRIIAAMTRVALAIRERGAASTRLPHDDLVRLWTHPRVQSSGPVEPVRTELLGEPGEFWTARRSPYYWLDPVEEPEEYRRSLQEFSLLRSDAQGHGFLHDSMIDFFQGLALREYDGADQPTRPSESWAEAVVKRIRGEIPRHRRCLEFLGGTLRSEELERLLEQFVLLDPVPAPWPGLLQGLTRGAVTSSEVAASVHRMTVYTGALIRRVPEQLAAQVYAHLYDSRSERVRAFSIRLRKDLTEGTEEKRCWLRLEVGSLPTDEWVMSEHLGMINVLAALPDGRIASASHDLTVRLWDPASGEASVISQVGTWVRALAQLPDGRVVVGCDDKAVRLVHPTDPMSRIVTRHEGRIETLAVLPDGHIASGSSDGVVRLSHVDSLESRVIIEHRAWVRALAVLPDGRLASGSDDWTVRLWDPVTGETSVITQHRDWVRAVATLPDGRVASGSADRTVRLWDPASGKSAIITQHDGRVWSLAVLPDGRIASGSDDTVRLWDCASGESAIITRHNRRASALAALPDGCIAIGSDDNVFQLWDSATRKSHIIARPYRVWSLAVLPDGRVASGSEDGMLRLWDPARVDSQAVQPHGPSVQRLRVLPDGRIAGGSWDGTVRLWDPTSGKSEVICKHNSSVWSLAVLPDGRVASGSEDMTVRLWDPVSGQSEVVTQHDSSVWSLAILPDGCIASGSHDGTVRLWNPASRESKAIARHSSSVWTLAVLPDGCIVSGSEDGTVRLWDAGMAESQVVAQYGHGVWALAVLPDGRIASAAWDGEVRLSDPSKGDSFIVTKHHGWVKDLIALPDGRIASASDDKTLRISSVPPESTLGTNSIEFAFTSPVLSAALDPRNGRLAAGFRDGRILIFAIEPHASDRAANARSDDSDACIMTQREA